MGVGILFATKLRVADGWHLVKAEGTYPATGHPPCSGPCAHHEVPIRPEGIYPTVGHPPTHRVPTPQCTAGEVLGVGCASCHVGQEGSAVGLGQGKKEEALECPSPARQHPGRCTWHLAHLHHSKSEFNITDC